MGGQASQHSPYNIPIEGSKQKGFSHIYRNQLSIDKLTQSINPQFSSVKDAIYDSMKRNKDRDCVGKIILKTVKEGEKTTDQRELVKFTYGQIFDMAEKVGSFLINNKMQFNEKEQNMKLVGIFSKNRYEWVVADLACVLYGLTIVPLYDTLGIDNLTYCLEHSGITTLFVTAGTIKTVLGLKGHGNLQNLICMDPLTPEIQQQLKSHKFKVFHFQDAIKQTKIVDHQAVKVTQKNCLTFSYTSGTTGPPKGAMLSHGNFLAIFASIKSHQIDGFKQDDVYVSFLPLPHVFQRVVVAALIYRGAFTAFYCGDILKFKDDLAFIKPTILVAVPRIYNRIVDNVKKTFEQVHGIKGWLVSNGLNSKLGSLHQKGQFSSFLYDKVVFSKVKEKFGGRIRMMITGSAPIKKQTYELMKVLMSCPFYEGYGQTQTTAATSLNGSLDNVSGHVGGIVSSLELKLCDIEQMHYTSEDKDVNGVLTPRGQIWVRGPSIFMGYYKDKQKTEETLTPDGWLKTGDVGMIMPVTNALKIIDRRKNIFKLQQGQYVAAQKVQVIYTKSDIINEAFLHGESQHNFAVAILIPNKKDLMQLAQHHKIEGTFQEICQDKKIKKIICQQLDGIGKRCGLMSFEQAKNIYIDPESFVTKGIVSSTMKLQRFAAKKYYSKQIQDMYTEGPLLAK